MYNILLYERANEIEHEFESQFRPFDHGDYYWKGGCKLDCQDC